jgi:hypothetical protein
VLVPLPPELPAPVAQATPAQVEPTPAQVEPTPAQVELTPALPEPPVRAKVLPKPVKAAGAPGLLPEVARRIERIERSLSKAEAAGEDVSSIRRELAVVRERLKQASPADAERLQFRLIDLETETAP